MRFVCESCRAQYMINDEKVGPKGVKVRCRKCGYVILVKRGGDAQAKGPVASAGADPDDALATQILQTPLTAAPPAAAKSMAGDTLADLTNPGVPEGKSQAPHDSLLGDAGDDEIGAVFDQVLNSGAHSISKEAIGNADDRRTEVHTAVKGSALGDDSEDRQSTRVIDAETVRKLAEESGDKPGQWDAKTDKSEKNGQHSEGEVPQNDWFVAIDEKQTGPLALEKVKEHWDRGEIGPDSLCWRAGFTDWVPLSDVAQLASVLAPRPASKPIVMNAPTGPSVVSVPVESAFSAGGVMKSVRSEVQVPIGTGTQPEETGSWRPSTSLGSLVQDEMAALSRPAPRMTEDPHEPADVSVNGLLDLPPPDEKPHTNGRTNGHAGASVDHSAQAPAPRSSRPAAPAPAPANPYVATPGATYSSPGITQYRPDKDRGNQMVWIALGLGGFLVVTLLGLVIWLANRQPTQIVQAPAPAPVMVAQAPTQPQPVAAQPVAAQPVAAQPVAAQPVAAQPVAAQPSGPLPPNAKSQPTPPRGSGGGTRVNSTGSGGGGTKVAVAAPAEKVEKPAPAEKKSAKSEEDDFDKAFGGGDSAKDSPKAAAPEKKKSGPYIPPAPGAASNDVKESLGQADVFEVVSGYKPALAKCVEEQRKKEPGVTGKLVMKWNIQTSGKTSNVSVQSEEFKSTYMAGCVGGLIKSWTFPKHKVAGDPIVFPFKF